VAGPGLSLAKVVAADTACALILGEQRAARREPSAHFTRIIRGVRRHYKGACDLRLDGVTSGMLGSVKVTSPMSVFTRLMLGPRSYGPWARSLSAQKATPSAGQKASRRDRIRLGDARLSWEKLVGGSGGHCHGTCNENSLVVPLGKQRIRRCQAPTWAESVLRLHRYFRWEYEDYDTDE
jgi:hypothetical protein